MKKTVWQTLCILLAGCLLISGVMTSCADTRESGDDGTASGTEEQSEAETSDPRYTDDLPQLNFGNKEINCIGANIVGVADEMLAEASNGDIINDAVYERNGFVEQRLGVKLNVTCKDSGAYDVNKTIENLVTTGDNEYQLSTSPSYVSAQYVTKGSFRNLSGFEYLNLDKLYWSQDYNRIASYGTGHQYMASGAMALSMFRYMYVTLYNKDMMVDRQITDPYTSVIEGKWTLDMQSAICNGIYVDSNGNARKDNEDTFGFVSGRTTSSDPYWICCDTRIVIKDEDNFYCYDPDVERIYAAMDKVLGLFKQEGTFYVSADSTLDNEVIETFARGNTLMSTVMIVKIENGLRDFTPNYGILPMPKFDEAQKDYKTCIQDQVTAVTVPATLPEEDFDMMGAVLECLASESYAHVVDAYYNTALSYKYLNNPESVVMLNLTYESASFEIAQIYTSCFGNAPDFLSMMRSIVTGGKNTVTSEYKSVKSRMSKGINQLNKAMEKLTK